MLKNTNNLENEIKTINDEFGLEEVNGEILTTSLNVAEVYGKEHRDIMRKIRHFIDVIPELAERNFTLARKTWWHNVR